MSFAWVAGYVLQGCGTVEQAAALVIDGWLQVTGDRITGWRTQYLTVCGQEPGDYTHSVVGGVARPVSGYSCHPPGELSSQRSFRGVQWDRRHEEWLQKLGPDVPCSPDPRHPLPPGAP